MAWDAMIEYAMKRGYPQIESSDLPVVTETYDGWLNDITALDYKKEYVFAALDNVNSGPGAEGNFCGGTGMTCHEFKGAIGTPSRIVVTASVNFKRGALVQANYGNQHLLRVDGIPFGRLVDREEPPSPYSIIVVITTDTTLLPIQCKRLARRASVGLARLGGISANADGHIYMAFATGNHILCEPDDAIPQQMLPHEQLSLFFEAAAEAVQEAIFNALAAAETMTGFEGHSAHALPDNRLVEIVRQYTYNVTAQLPWKGGVQKKVKPFFEHPHHP